MENFSQLIKKESLEKRFQKKISYSRVSGVDGISPDQFKRNLDSELDTIHRKINGLSYRFSPFKEKLISKGKNAYPRVVYIPTVRDRVVISALNSHLSTAFQEELKICQRPLQVTIEEVINEYTNHKYDSFLKFDIKDFYQSIEHDSLMKILREGVSDKRVISLLKKLLNRTGCKGVPQGASISGLLANLFLFKVDKAFMVDRKVSYFRFVDDILIFCNQKDVDAVEQKLREAIKFQGLELHSAGQGSKTIRGKLPEEPFEYLGYAFNKGRISVRESTLKRLHNQLIKLMTQYAREHIGEEEFYQKINIKITGCYFNGKSYGWLFYFKYINDLTLLYKLDRLVENKFRQFGIMHNSSKVKSFVRSYYEVNNHKKNILTEESYIPSYESYDKNQFQSDSINIDSLFIKESEALRIAYI